MRRVGLVAAAAVLVVGAVACDSADTAADGQGAGASSSAPPKSPSASAAPAVVKIASARYEDHEVWGDNAYVVRWELTNTGDQAGNFYTGLDFLDADGDVLGSTGITADKVGPGKTAKGEASPLDAEIDKGPMDAIKDVKVSEVQRLDY
ncbi:hypothetical protein AB0O68_35975 [Streptomyces sp. NPDC087512]|uniref:hypothetical protein n=1 Tax=Streptomyces sp. NPDC087512 TaxID=3155059 RepID=UPI0034128935